jgi:hypothetical protein
LGLAGAWWTVEQDPSVETEPEVSERVSEMEDPVDVVIDGPPDLVR